MTVCKDFLTFPEKYCIYTPLKISAVLVQMYYHHHNRLAANFVKAFVNDCDKYTQIKIFIR